MPTPLPVLAGVYYGYIRGTYEGLPTGNTVCFKESVATSSSTAAMDRAQVIATAMTSNWATTLGPLQPNIVTGWDSRVYALGFPVLPAALGHTTGSGGLASAISAASAAVVIRHGVLRRGRGSQSHSAWSPVPKAYVDDNGQNVADSYRLGLTEEWENWIAAIQLAFSDFTTGLDLAYVQLSKKGAGATYPIVLTQAEAILGTERSRTARP